ncbi:hypothetical protein B7494_g5390 [Chlorociboria aeruginascens]|nr:hypothetical protein B7494_g5390 [Chlorociboria aeruginascens]
MSENSKKRTLDEFFNPPVKKPRVSDTEEESLIKPSEEQVEFTHHANYPFPIACFPDSLSKELTSLPSTTGKPINDQADLDLVYFEPFIPKYLERQIFEFLRRELPFYKVKYNIKRGGIESQVVTPRYTTIFGIDKTARFNDSGEVVDSETGKKLEKDKNYPKYPPRPIPRCLDDLRLSAEAATGCKFNFCLVNYYSSGSDSISYHSDDERFLGPLPSIASFSLGANRDFLMKHKPIAPKDNALPPADTKPIKLPLGSGDMILMKGTTQANWLHSIPKRTGKNADGGRINITFRKALVRSGTDNYYNYNIGMGLVHKWDKNAREMKVWNA